MKRVLAIISIGLICFGLVACGNGDEPPNVDSDNSMQDSGSSLVDEGEKDSVELILSKTASVGEAFRTGDFEVVLDSVSKSSDQNGSEFVTLSFSFTNRGGMDSDFMNNLLVEVFQGDTSLSAAPDMGETSKQNFTVSAAPGETVEGVTLPFYTRDSGELNIEVQAASELGLSEPVSIKTGMPE